MEKTINLRKIGESKYTEVTIVTLTAKWEVRYYFNTSIPIEKLKNMTIEHCLNLFNKYEYELNHQTIMNCTKSVHSRNYFEWSINKHTK